MSKFSKNFIEGFIGVIVMGFLDDAYDWVTGTGSEYLKRGALALLPAGVGSVYGIPSYLQGDLAGGSTLFNNNSLAINDMANWYNTHKHNTRLGTKPVWDTRPSGWGGSSFLPNGVPAKSWYDFHDGEDNLKTAFELAEKINPNKYREPVNDTDIFNAYKHYAKDGILELGDDGNLWDIYAADSRYANKNKPVQHANWLAAYRDDVNYLAKLAAEGGEDNLWKYAYDHFKTMAASDDMSRLDRQDFRDIISRVHALRMQNPNRFFEEKDTENASTESNTKNVLPNPNQWGRNGDQPSKLVQRIRGGK